MSSNQEVQLISYLSLKTEKNEVSDIIKVGYFSPSAYGYVHKKGKLLSQLEELSPQEADTIKRQYSECMEREKKRPVLWQYGVDAQDAVKIISVFLEKYYAK